MCKFRLLILVLLWEITQAYTISPTAYKEKVPSIRASGAVLQTVTFTLIILQEREAETILKRYPVALLNTRVYQD